MSEWRPIESAPRDGTLVLVFDPEGVEHGFRGYSYDGWPEDERYRILPARWVPNNWNGGEWESMIPDYDFGVASDPSFTADPLAVEPSHWMPLPEPPK